MELLTFALVLRRMSALPKVLMLCQRLGGVITYVSAADGKANIAMMAPDYAVHRFGPQLRRIIDVLDVKEMHVVSRKRSAIRSVPQPAVAAYA